MEGMKNSTPCWGVGLVNEGVMMSVKLASSLAKLSSADAIVSRCRTDALILCRVIDVKSEGSIGC